MKIYLIKEESTNLYKIGMTTKAITERISNLQTGNPNKLVLIDFFETKYKKIEQFIHARFKKYKVKGEWFDLPLEEVVTFKKTCRECESNYIYLKEHNYFIN